MRRKLTVLVALGAALSVFAVAAQATGMRTVTTQGEEIFVPNGVIEATMHFDPGNINVRTGATIQWVHEDSTRDPHTISVVNRSDLPNSVKQVFNCGGPGTVCRKFLKQHFPPNSPPVRRIDVGANGLDQVGDSLLLLPNHPISAVVSAPEGTVLYYLCAIHAWMQGTITVTD